MIAEGAKQFGRIVDRLLYRSTALWRSTAVVALLTGTLGAQAAHAYTITITAGARSIYLQVGAGGYVGTNASGGTPSFLKSWKRWARPCAVSQARAFLTVSQLGMPCTVIMGRDCP